MALNLDTLSILYYFNFQCVSAAAAARIRNTTLHLINPIRTEGVSRKHTSYIIDSHVKMSEVNGFFFLDFAN